MKKSNVIMSISTDIGTELNDFHESFFYFLQLA